MEFTSKVYDKRARRHGHPLDSQRARPRARITQFATEPGPFSFRLPSSYFIRFNCAPRKPSPPPLPLPTQCHRSPAPPQMAFQHADPAPFIPHGMHLQHVDNRKFMVRAMAGSRPIPRNEEWAIATIQPLPGIVLNFQNVRAVLDDFFADQARVQILSIQRSHLGQALIKFARVHDRDTRVLNRPHQFGNVSISFVRHNKRVTGGESTLTVRSGCCS